MENFYSLNITPKNNFTKKGLNYNEIIKNIDEILKLSKKEYQIIIYCKIKKKIIFKKIEKKMKIKRKLFREEIFKKDFSIFYKNLKILNFNFEKKKLLIISKKKIFKNFDYIKSFLRFSIEKEDFVNLPKLFELNFLQNFEIEKKNDFFENKEIILFDDNKSDITISSSKKKKYLKKFEKFKKKKKFHFFLKILFFLGFLALFLIGFEIFQFFQKKKFLHKKNHHGFHKRIENKWKPLNQYHSFKTPVFLKH